jgi:cysteine synthase B
MQPNSACGGTAAPDPRRQVLFNPENTSMTAVESIITSKVEGSRKRNVWALIGNTPLIHLRRVTRGLPANVQVYGKAEWFNPGGSVKDRPAAAILQAALNSGQLEGGRVFLDSTSGNMGIAYATLGAALNIPIHLAVPSNASPERLSILRALGAEITLTDPLEGSEGAREVAAELAESEPGKYFYANQYDNPANAQAHYQTTGPEIHRQTQARVTHFVAGMGTTGTLMGAGRYLKEELPQVELVGLQPDSPLHGLEGLKHLPTSEVPTIYDASLPDRILKVATEDAYAMARRLAREEGLFVGVSAAAAVEASIKLGVELHAGTIVAILPDSGMKYLSQSFWGES